MPIKIMNLAKQNQNKKVDSAHCCSGPVVKLAEGLKKIALVGNPNVGKSVMFNNLTGVYAQVSNYPGTTVDVTRGKGKIGEHEFEVIDTPGMYALYPLSEEERVARDILLNEPLALVLHVVDAKNLARMLPFTLQLIEAGLPVALVLNMSDELRKAGLAIATEQLAGALKIPVITTSGPQKEGLVELKEMIAAYLMRTEQAGNMSPLFTYQPADTNSPNPEAALEEIELLLTGQHALSKRALSLLVLQEEPSIEPYLAEKTGTELAGLKELVQALKQTTAVPWEYLINQQRQAFASGLVRAVMHVQKKPRHSFQQTLSKLTMNPLTGLPILILVLYFGLYQLVGVFGAGVVVNFLEGTVFGKYVGPFMTYLVEHIIPANWNFSEILKSLFVGEYGLFTLGLRYAFGIIFPIVTIFFFVFAIIEDSGYLPRLAMLIDSVFKRIGLSGRAVIPMVLGLGCDTMATVVTRTLPTKRERIIATFLLALAIPCSAQLGVILALLGSSPLRMLVWLGVLVLVFLATGFLTARFLPGEKPVFYMEIPPLRLPSPVNVLVKTITRVEWYLKEIIPLFLLGSVIIWLGQISGLFNLLIGLIRYPLHALGIPGEAAPVFLLGFFRRDYGAAGLYDLQNQGLLSGNQMVIAAIVLTLFLPCIAQFMMIIKERGLKTGIYVSTAVLVISFAVAFTVNFILNTLGVVL